ncbi:MAG: NAD(P)/FAD-dependent oxidoreductase, partial [Bacillota bacterium]
MDADVIVVGAGPAGSWLAYNLARKGVKVLILEKESWPRYKACGGAVSRKTLNILKKGNITLPEYVIKNVVDNFVFRFDFQKSFSYHYKNEGISLVKREKFDDSLLNYACREGAIFRSRQEVNEIEILENKVKVKAGNKLYQGKIIVGADG